VAIQHELSWSTSRARTFDSCPRKYYWDYYGSWRGWERGAETERKQAYLLKKMTRMPMWAGDCLHVALEWWFERRRAGITPGPDEVKQHALGRLREGYKQSRDGLWKQRPSKLTHLAEHHYSEPDIDEGSGAAATYGKRFVGRIEQGTDGFFADPALAPVREAEPESWLACEELGTIELYGTKVYAIPDFAFRRKVDGVEQVLIYDWKTGREREADKFQLALYVLYAAQRWGTEPENTICVDAYLPEARCVEMRFTTEQLDDVLGRVQSSMHAMREVHFDADREDGDIEAFPMRGDDPDGLRECSRCNYRELCGR
jgi:hypothetical protein